MIKEINGEEVVLNYYTDIENKESLEIQNLIDKYQEEFNKKSTYLILAIMSFIFSLISFFAIINTAEIAGVILGIIFFISFICFTITYIFHTAHLRIMLKELKEMLRIAKLNDEERHKEKIRYEERKRLEELDQMKQVEIKTKSLPPRKPKENNK